MCTWEILVTSICDLQIEHIDLKLPHVKLHMHILAFGLFDRCRSTSQLSIASVIIESASNILHEVMYEFLVMLYIINSSIWHVYVYAVTLSMEYKFVVPECMSFKLFIIGNIRHTLKNIYLQKYYIIPFANWPIAKNGIMG